jgi:hypothetical protein
MRYIVYDLDSPEPTVKKEFYVGRRLSDQIDPLLRTNLMTQRITRRGVAGDSNTKYEVVPVND